MYQGRTPETEEKGMEGGRKIGGGREDKGGVSFSSEGRSRQSIVGACSLDYPPDSSQIFLKKHVQQFNLERTCESGGHTQESKGDARPLPPYTTHRPDATGADAY